jgi:hypothetical protein
LLTAAKAAEETSDGYRYLAISLRSRSISTRDRCVFLLNLRIDVGKSTAIISRAARAPHNEAAVIPEFVVAHGYPEAAQASRRAGKQICKGRKPCSESSAQREPFWLALLTLPAVRAPY